MTMFFVLSKKVSFNSFQMEATYFSLDKDMSDMK